MKKLMIIGAFLVAITGAAHAQQENISLNAAAMAGVSIGDFSEVYGLGLGISLKGIYNINPSGDLTLTTGYSRFGLKDSYDAGLKGSLGIIPLFGGYRHHMGQLYLEPQLGLSINTSSFKANMGDWGSFDGSASTTSLGYAATVGYLLGDIDLSIRYQGFSLSGSGLGFIGLHVGYQFQIN